jgi:hypothetical protein
LSIYRIQSGLIFDDSFDTLDSSRWLLSPSDSCTYDESNKRLILNHNDTDRSTNALFELPEDEEELLLQIHADYTPTELGDEGGLVVWKNALEKVEFLESEDTKRNETYSVWRAVKKRNLWTFFAQTGNSWELFDSTICINPTMAGVVLKGVPKDGYVPLNVDRVIFCKGSSISIGNINSQYKVKLLDSGGAEVAEKVVPDGFSGITIELPSIPFEGKIQLFDKSENGDYVLVDELEEATTMYGGDVFLRGTDLKVIWNGKELSELKPTHLGAMKSDSIEQKMTVLNPSIGNVAENVQIRIAMFNDEFGWSWADLAHDVDGSPGTYEDTSINMGTLFAGQSKDFWVKVARNDSDTATESKEKMRPTHFILEIYND